MKKAIFAFILCFLVSVPAFAFLYEMEILSVEQIAKLSDKQLSDVYFEAKIEEVASSEFHEAAGFSNAKDYKKRKDLLRFILNLRREMAKRGLEAEPIDQWLQ